MNFKKKGDKARYNFLDARCIGRTCWAPGVFQHRGATLGGSRNTGAYSACCMNRAYHGCPDGPEGETQQPCGQCDATEREHCRFCGGAGLVTIVGVREYSKDLADKRKQEGWTRA